MLRLFGKHDYLLWYHIPTMPDEPGAIVATSSAKGVNPMNKRNWTHIVRAVSLTESNIEPHWVRTHPNMVEAYRDFLSSHPEDFDYMAVNLPDDVYPLWLDLFELLTAPLTPDTTLKALALKEVLSGFGWYVVMTDKGLNLVL